MINSVVNLVREYCSSINNRQQIVDTILNNINDYTITIYENDLIEIKKAVSDLDDKKHGYTISYIIYIILISQYETLEACRLHTVFKSTRIKRV